MDINKPVTNPKLLHVMNGLQNDPSKEYKFYTILFKAKLLCTVYIDFKNTIKGAQGEITVGEESAIDLISLDNQQGKHFLIAFTDWKEIRKWKKVYSNEMTIQAEESVMIGIPRDYSNNMIQKLKQKFKGIMDIKSAYLLWTAKNNETSYLLVLDARGSEEKLFPIVGKICKPYSNFGQDVVENQKTFYETKG